MAGGPPAFPREITDLSFFFSNFRNSDEAAEYVIANDRGPGTFLLRPSTRSPGILTLTISIDNNHARHVNVRRRPDDGESGVAFFIIPERSFSSFHELYAYYTANTICNMEQVNNVRLLNPLQRTQQITATSASSLPGSSPSVQALAVTHDEIPPLPRKPSTGSGVGADSMRHSPGNFYHTNSNYQTGLSEFLPAYQRQDRSSLDSQGNENPRTSSSSSGSGTVIARDSMGAVGGIDPGTGGVQYLAPGSPGFGDWGSTSPLPTQLDGFYPDRSKFQDPSTSVPIPLPNKDQKKLQKQLQKEEKLRKKEEKKEKKKKNKKAEMEELVQLGWCRPPMPTPEAKSEEEQPYYSSPRPYKNHLEELKQMLRESEICDCGLRMLDAELVAGWTVHRSRETATFRRVFYQHEDGNTTWVFPNSITDLLSVQQVQFIVQLCREGSQDVPSQVLRRHQNISQSAVGIIHLQSTSSITSSRSRSSSNSSDQFCPAATFNRSASLDQRPPMSGPDGGGW